MRKRILSLIMVLVMIFGMMPVNVLAAEIPADAPFQSITANASGDVTAVSRDTVDVDLGDYGTYSGIPLYHVTVPAGTTEVQVTYSADRNVYLGEGDYAGEAYGYYAETSGWTGGGVTLSGVQNEDGTITVTIPMSKSFEDWSVGNVDADFANGYAVGPEDTGYAPINFFTFEYAAAEAPHEHSYGEEVTTAATCGTAGVKTFTCACGDSYTEEIAATGEHSYGEEVTTAATCGAAGVKTFTCSVCGDSYTEEIAATGEHSYADGSCTVCGTADPDAEPAHTHSYTDGVCSCGAMENVVVYSGSDWPYSRYYIANLKLSGLKVDYVSGTDIYVNHTTASDAEFTMTATAGGSSSGNLGVNWNDDSTNTMTYSGSLADGTASVKIYAYKASGAGVSRSGTKTFTIHTAAPNEVPTLAEGVNAAVEETITALNTYELDLSTIFADADNDALTYTVAIDGGSAAATEAAYSYAANIPGTYTLVFTATDGKTMNPPTHTVTLAVVNSTVTYDVPVTLPEGVGDVTFKAVNSVSGSTLTLGDTLTVEEGVIKVPENITRIAWECEGYVCGSAATAADTALVLAKVSFAIAAGETTDSSATVKITGADSIAISGGAADSYLIAAGAGYTYAITPSSSTYRSVTLTEQTATTGEVEVALELKQFTVIAPADSVVSAGTLSGSFQYSFATPLSTDTKGDTVTYTFAPLSGNAFIRVQRPNDPDAVTYWDYKSSKADGQTITVTEAMLFMNDNGDFNASTVYRNFEYYSLDLGDIYLNINPQGYVNLNVGETKQLNVFRNWQAIESFFNAKIALPDFRYDVVNIEGDNVLSITPDANNSATAAMTATGEGTAIVLVTYDAMYSELTAGNSGGAAGGANRFSAIWPDRTGVFVVSVGKDGTSISSNMTCNGASFDAEHSPQFYTGTAGASVSFTPDAGCDVTVSRGVVGAEKLSFGDFTKTGVDVNEETGEVTVSGLTTGRHIIRLVKDGVASYQVVTAQQATVAITDANSNSLTEESKVKPGDTVTLTIKGLTNPAEKFATKYNFNAQLTYLDQKGNTYANTSGTGYGKYDFSSGYQVVSVAIPADWDQETLTLNGYITMGGFAGDGIGSHRKVSYGIASGMAQGSAAGMQLGTLPEITLQIQTCNITLPEGEGYTVTATEDSTSPVVYGGSYSFTVEVAEGYDATNMKVLAGSVELIADESGVYTIYEIDSDVPVTVEGVVKASASTELTIPDGAPFVAIEGATAIEDKGMVTLVDYYGNNHPEAPYYHVTVPAGTESVAVTYNQDADVFFSAEYGNAVYGYYAATADWGSGAATVSGVQNEDGSITVTIPMSLEVTDWNSGETNTYGFLLDDGYVIGPEKTEANAYAPINVFSFEYEEDPDACEHSYGEGEVTTEPTCGAAGEKTLTCSKCGDTKTETIAATGEHSYEGSVSVDATCGDAGVMSYTCSVCGDNYTEAIAATGKHSYSSVTTEPTCGAAGQKTYTCNVCGDSYSEEIAATGEHSYADDGYCSVCGAADPAIVPELVGGVYQIADAADLIWFAKTVNGGETAIQGALTADIDLTGKEWPGIGVDDNRFAGSFNGANHKVTFMDSAYGLFAYVQGTSSDYADIRNVVIEGSLTGSGVADIVAYANIESCVNRADISNSEKDYVAGIVGQVKNTSWKGESGATITNCLNEGDITGKSYVGGILGYSQSNTQITGSANRGDISGSTNVGGLAGYLQGYNSTCAISNSYNSGKVSGSSLTGGLVGNLYNEASITNSYNSGESYYALAGAVYNEKATISNCYYLASRSYEAAPWDELHSGVSCSAVPSWEMSEAVFSGKLGSAFLNSCPTPVLSWETAAAHSGLEDDGVCDSCRASTGEGTRTPATYNVTRPTGTGYTVSGDDTVTEEGSYSFTLGFASGYGAGESFAVRANGVVVTEADGSYTVEKVLGPLNITVSGVEEVASSYTVTLPAKGNGYHVDPVEGSSSPVAEGGSYSFTVTFPTGFRAGEDFKVLANGSTLTAVDGVYTIENVTADQTVTVTGVELIPYADTTSVTITVSSETMDFYRAPGSGDLLLLKDLEVPYFDLSLYGLQKYYYHPNSYDATPYQAGNTELAYGVVTGMHALIYATEVFYLDYDAEDAGQGESYRTDTDGDGVSDFEEAISWTGGPGSSFMDLWGRGTNLNYYADYTYPMSSIDGIGATSDQIAIYDGYKIDVHFIENSAASGSDYGFLAVNDTNGSFDGVNTDTVDYATVKQGDALTLTMFTAGEGSNYETTYWTTEGRKVYWTETSNVTDSITGWKRTDFGGLTADTLVTGANGLLTLDTTKIEPGTYYIAAEGGFREGGQVDNAGFVSQGKQAGPAVLCLTVLEGEIQPEPEVVLGDYDGDGELKMTDIAKTYKAFQEETELTDAQLAALDVNGNGKLDMSDFAKIYAAFKVQ